MVARTGTRVGNYELIELLGRGGMGEVYRARDTRARKDVALKLLLPALADDPDIVRRFALEGQAAQRLQHPNIVAVHGAESAEGTPYIVAELLQGETLRARLARGPLPPREAVSIAIQIARGLAAAHDAGVLHRDVKPENVFLARGGRVKLLDFGLARLYRRPVFEGGRDVTLPPAGATSLGLALGTVDYMAPEQVRGDAASPRSDVFSLGVVLWEMLAGGRLFQRDSAVESMAAILRDEPPDLAARLSGVPPALARMVRTCLAKSPDDRYQTARDVALTLELLADPEDVKGLGGARLRTRLARIVAGVALAALALSAAAWFAGRARGVVAGRKDTMPAPSFQRLTYRRGFVWWGQFTADGASVAYAASFAGRPIELFTTRIGSRESRPLGMPGTGLLAMSRNDEMAIQLHHVSLQPNIASGTLARVSLSGGGPRQLAEDVIDADWAPNGEDLAVVRVVGDSCRLEYPIGRVLYARPGRLLRSPRVAPRGDAVAFMEYETFPGGLGWVTVRQADGRILRLHRGWLRTCGLEWAPNGREVWFGTGESAGSRAIYAADFAGRKRLLMRLANPLMMMDVSRNGDILLSREMIVTSILARPPGEGRERDLSWLDESILAGLSADGRYILISEQGEGAGDTPAIFLRPTDGGDAIRLGQGWTYGLSADGRFALCRLADRQDQLAVVPTLEPGETRFLAAPGLEHVDGGIVLAGGRLVVATGETAPGERRTVLLDLVSRTFRPLTPPGWSPLCVAPDGRALLAASAGRAPRVYPIGEGEPYEARGLDLANASNLSFTDRPDEVFECRAEGLGRACDRVNLRTGERRPWLDVTPGDLGGAFPGGPLFVTPDGRAYAYAYARFLSTLYQVTGVR